MERYRKIFTDDDLAAPVFTQVTVQLVEWLERDVSQQRLDSTHVFSHRSTFGRVK